MQNSLSLEKGGTRGCHDRGAAPDSIMLRAPPQAIRNHYPPEALISRVSRGCVYWSEHSTTRPDAQHEEESQAGGGRAAGGAGPRQNRRFSMLGGAS